MVNKLWEANKVWQSAIAESRHCDVMSELYYAACVLLHIEALHIPVSNPLRNMMRVCWSVILATVQLDTATWLDLIIYTT